MNTYNSNQIRQSTLDTSCQQFLMTCPGWYAKSRVVVLLFTSAYVSGSQGGMYASPSVEPQKGMTGSTFQGGRFAGRSFSCLTSLFLTPPRGILNRFRILAKGLFPVGVEQGLLSFF